MKTRHLFSMLFAILMFTVHVSPAFALTKDYIYRQRANWVKLNKLSNKQLAGVVLNHPQAIGSDRIEAMMLSLKINKGTVFKKEDAEDNLFTIEEAKRFAPMIADALNRAGPNQVVNVAVVHERNRFILQYDFISIMNVFVTDDGVHFNFTKLVAKLRSDWEASSKQDRAIMDAKSMRISLAAGPGQKIGSSDNEEIVMETGFDFGTTAGRTVPAEETYNPLAKKSSATKPAQNSQERYVPTNSQPTPQNFSNDTTAERLKRLDDLKRQKLITPKEYDAKRQEILGDL